MLKNKKIFLTLMFILCSIGIPYVTASDDINTHYQFIETKVDVGDAVLFCRSVGEGTPVIVLHGGAGLTQDYLLPELARLSEEHLVIFYDQRACGQSSGDVSLDSINIENYVNDLLTLRTSELKEVL